MLTRFNNLRVGAKLLAGFLTLSLITAVVGIVGIRNMSRINDLNDRLYERELVGLSHVKESNIELALFGRAMRSVLLADTEQEFARASGEMRRATGALEASLDSAMALTTTPEGKELVASATTAWQRYRDAGADILAASAEEGLQQQRGSLSLLQASRAQASAADSALGLLARRRVAQAGAAAVEATAIYERSRLYMILLVVGSIMSGVAIGWALSHRISRSVRLVAACAEQVRTQAIAPIAEASEAMARGELTASITVDLAPLDADSGDELGDLARTMNGIVAQSRSAAAAFDRALGTLRDVIGETETLIVAAQAGQLAARGQEARFEGGYRMVVGGLNRTLDAVVSPLTEAQAVLARIAERDLTAQMSGAYEGDFAAMQKSLNGAVDNLVVALDEVEAATTQVATAGEQISAGSHSLAAGASEQASSLEEVSANLQEMTAMSLQSAANAREARSLAEATRASTTTGVESVERLSEAMDKIKTSSNETARILKTIEEIAFQTNLLALNAAVEAARAGDHGRGFAVVAEEVRALALRAAEAARQTATLVEASVRHASEGVTLNAAVEAQLREVDVQAERVTTVVTEIAEASEQQSQGVQQINVAVEQMNAVTQQVAANAEESAAAATELSSQASHMREIVGTFQLDRTARSGTSDASGARGTDPGAARGNGTPATGRHAGRGVPRHHGANGRRRGGRGSQMTSDRAVLSDF